MLQLNLFSCQINHSFIIKNGSYKYKVYRHWSQKITKKMYIMVYKFCPKMVNLAHCLMEILVTY